VWHIGWLGDGTCASNHQKTVETLLSGLYGSKPLQGTLSAERLQNQLWGRPYEEGLPPGSGASTVVRSRGQRWGEMG